MELLSPAGSYEAMTAAVRAGADAVYLGAGDFHARRHADGFSLDPNAERSLAAAVTYCHARGVAVHAALNILVTEREFDDALAAAYAAAEAGVDALIVQDRGLARAIRRALPQMPLHASTQLTCHTPSGVRQLRDDGFTRVVLAREMTLDEIKACADLGCKLEVFVHGALCMSVSGQCELSALLGGRSGNRGLCAQPCRLPFTVDGGDLPNALSLKDLSLRDRLDDLRRAGVCSLKIEGRMKRPEYVAAATASFRRALDGYEPDEQLEHDLQAVFSRDGFTDGYLTGRRGRAMFGVRRYEDVTAADNKVFSRLARLYDKERQTVSVSARLHARLGEPITLTMTDGEHTVTVTGENPTAAVSVPLSPDRAREQLQKSGGTPFTVTADCDIEGSLSVPVSHLNALRREGLERLLEARTQVAALNRGKLPAPTPLPDGLLHGLVARVPSSAHIVDGADHYVLPLGDKTDKPFGVEIPRGMFSDEDRILQQLKQAKAQGARFAVCGTVGALPLARAAGLPAVAGYSLHIANSGALSAAAESGVQAAVLSFELHRRATSFAEDMGCTGLFVYGRQPLMLLRNCPVKAAKGCAACGGHGELVDRKGVRFPVMCHGACSELYNSVPLYLADRDFWKRFPFAYLHFTDDTPDRIAEVLREYREGGTPPATGFTRGLYDKGWVKE